MSNCNFLKLKSKLGSHDYNQNLSAVSDTVLPITSWAKGDVRTFGKQFAKWVSYTEELKAGRGSNVAEQSENTPKGTIYKLSKQESGLPILPDPVLTESGIELLGVKRDILWQFIVEHYHKYSSYSSYIQ